MSLLPQTILFPSMPIGRVEVDSEGKPTGNVLLEMNWWLFFYGISQQVLGSPSGGSTVGLPATALIELASLEADAADADAISLRADVRSALMYAQDDLLPDVLRASAPTAKVGLAAVVGIAQTFLRSDGAPPIDQSITPTWTGAHNFSNNFLGNATTSVLGYATGSGGAVTQVTSRTTGVTLNQITGAITLFSAAGSATAATFTVTNSTVAATDTIIISAKSGTNVYLTWVTAVAAGSFNITFNTTGGTATDSPVFNFAVIKGAAS